MWWWYSSARGAWGAPYNTALETRCQSPWPSYTYNRRAANISLDDGVDPYGAAWAMWGNTPLNNFYHINVYSTGSTTSGFDYASHGAAWTLANYQEPVGVVIGNGGHFVLITYVESDVSPLSNFWTPISLFRYRDPIRAQGAYPYNGNRVDVFYSAWSNVYNEYGWSGHSFVPAPNCDVPDPNAINANCRDEARGGPWANNLWWGKWVTIERDQTGQNNPDWVWRNSQ